MLIFLISADAKKEEMIRYSRARQDEEYLQMLQVRSLGPQHKENQEKLRKSQQVEGSVRTVEDAHVRAEYRE